MHDEAFSPQTTEQEPAVNLDTLSCEGIEHLIAEGNKILKKHKDEEIKQFQAKVRRKDFPRAVRTPTESGLGGRRWYAKEVKYWVSKNREPVI